MAKQLFKSYEIFISYLHLFSIIVVVICQACNRSSEDYVYHTKSKKPFSKHLFQFNGKFCFSDLRDSSTVFVKNENLVFTTWREDTIYYEKLLLKFETYNPGLIEASNEEMGNFSYCRNFNYDLKLKDKKLDINIIFPESLKGSYSILLDDKRFDLINKSLGLIDKKKTINLKDTVRLNFEKSQILILYSKRKGLQKRQMEIES